jgi:hypothetical protein
MSPCKSDAIVVDAWRGPPWRRTAHIDGGLRVRLEREENDGAVVTAGVTIRNLPDGLRQPGRPGLPHPSRCISG